MTSPCCSDPPARRHEGGAPALKLVAAMALVAAAALTGRTVQAAGPAARHGHTVIIEALSYSPHTLIVRRGDRITWVNKDPIPHTVTAGDGAFDSHSIAAGHSWTYVARKVGVYDYGCTFHVTMKGRLEVR